MRLAVFYEQKIDKLKLKASRLRFELTTTLEQLSLVESQYAEFKENSK